MSLTVLNAWVFLPLLIAGWILFLVGWELGPRGQQTPAGGEDRHPHAALRGPAHRALETHLMFWVFFAALCFALVLLQNQSRQEPGIGTLLLFPLGALVALTTTHLGKRYRAKRKFPAGLRWLLAPFHGLSIWLLLVSGQLRTIRRRRQAWIRGRNRAENGPTPESPRDSIHAGVRELDALTLEEVLIPRSQEVALQGDLTLREALDRIGKARHKLYPVFGESVDQPLGVVRMLDLAQPKDPDRRVRELVIPAPIVPETMNGVSLLRRLGGAPLPVALVVDEFGSHAGFVTVEDLIEVLVGELAGEHEVERKRILPVEPGVFRVEGTCRIEEFNEQIVPVLPEGEYETVAGLFIDRVGRIPQLSDELALSGATLEVLERTDRRILWISITLNGPAESNG